MEIENQRFFVAYYRVSTSKQGLSGLGLDAQREAVKRYTLTGGWKLVGEFTEVETGKGANALAKRPQLRDAIALCKKTGAVLVIAKLDRLARNVHFISGLLEQGCEFVAADMPGATKTQIHIYAAMSEWERDQISQRTKAALQEAKARGKILGKAGPANLKRNIEQRQAAADSFAKQLEITVTSLRNSGLTQRAIVEELNRLQVPTPNGRTTWSLVQVQRLLTRISNLKVTAVSFG